VQYQPHANAHNRKLNPALYYIGLFMNLLLVSVLTFFLIHTILWLIRQRLEQVKRKSTDGGHNA
jgi:antibiotic biosynthesis monooxygenase (ABM) superfamily enzyme